MDDKDYLYIAITKENYPKVITVRKQDLDLAKKLTLDIDEMEKMLNEYLQFTSSSYMEKDEAFNLSELIEDVINKYGENAKIHLGGIPMIADDMMSYIKSDIVVFGIGVFIFIILGHRCIWCSGFSVSYGRGVFWSALSGDRARSWIGSIGRR